MAEYDVVIVGSGLAGLTAGLFAARYGLSTLVLEANIPGGHLINLEKRLRLRKWDSRSDNRKSKIQNLAKNI
jgi:thioredoxin reductase